MLVPISRLQAWMLKDMQAEDWQSEKCDVSLLEGVPVKHILVQLEDAAHWLSRTTKCSPF